MFDQEIPLNSGNVIKYGFIGKKDINLPNHFYVNSANSRENVSKAARYINPELSNVAVLKQRHSTIVHIRQGEFSVHEGDGQVTSAKQMPLAVQTADCVPIIFFDPKNVVVGIAHAGWRGAKSGIIESTIEKMLKLGANLTYMHSVIGPCIHQKSYEVSKDFHEDFLEEEPENKKFFIPSTKQNHYMFDLPKYCSSKISDEGITNIRNVDSDTYANEDLWFSYRRCTHAGKSKVDGQNLSYVVIL